MRIGISILVGAVGAFLRFEVAAQAAGFKVHAVGVIMMVGGIVGVVASVMYRNTWGGFNRGHAFGSGDTVLIDRVAFPRAFQVERPSTRARRNDAVVRLREET